MNYNLICRFCLSKSDRLLILDLSDYLLECLKRLASRLFKTLLGSLRRSGYEWKITRAILVIFLLYQTPDGSSRWHGLVEGLLAALQQKESANKKRERERDPLMD